MVNKGTLVVRCQEFDAFISHWSFLTLTKKFELSIEFPLINKLENNEGILVVSSFELDIFLYSTFFLS